MDSFFRSAITFMHCITLAQFASQIAQHADVWAQTPDEIPTDAIHTYWISAKTRHQQWHEALSQFRDARNEADFGALRHYWSYYLPVLQEIVVSDQLSRMVATVADMKQQAGDAHESAASFFAIANGVYFSGLECSNRLANLLLTPAGVETRDLVMLNRLRRTCERWTDWQIGLMNLGSQRSFRFCFDVDRGETFRDELKLSKDRGQLELATQLLTMSMLGSYQRYLSKRDGLKRNNQQWVESIMALLHPAMFDLTGLPMSVPGSQSAQENAGSVFT